jgi:hypothetical protein
MFTRIRAGWSTVTVPVVLLLLLSTLGGGCTQTITNLNASRGTLYASLGLGNVGDAACQPAPAIAAPPEPGVWWSGLDPQTRTKVVAGFQIWSHGAPGCTSHRVDAYRGLFEYSLAPITALSSTSSPIGPRITDATLTLTIQGFSTPDVIPGVGAPACGSRSGGIASLMLLPGGTPVLTGPTNMNKIATNNGVPDFPTSTRTITPISTLSFGGAQTPPATITILDPTRSQIDIDVKNALLFALNSGQSTVGFMLTGTGEMMTAAIPANRQVECKTLVTLGTLTVKNN